MSAIAPPPRIGGRTYMVTPQTPFGQVLREERLKRGLKQKELAEKVGLVQPQISAYERGVIKHPDPAVVAALDVVFGFTQGELFTRAGWQGAARRVESTPPPGSMVVLGAKERPHLPALIEMIIDLDDDKHLELMDTVRFINEPAGEPENSSSHEASSA